MRKLWVVASELKDDAGGVVAVNCAKTSVRLERNGPLIDAVEKLTGLPVVEGAKNGGVKFDEVTAIAQGASHLVLRLCARKLTLSFDLMPFSSAKARRLRAAVVKRKLWHSGGHGGNYGRGFLVRHSSDACVYIESRHLCVKPFVCCILACVMLCACPSVVASEISASKARRMRAVVVRRNPFATARGKLLAEDYLQSLVKMEATSDLHCDGMFPVLRGLLPCRLRVACPWGIARQKEWYFDRFNYSDGVICGSVPAKPPCGDVGAEPGLPKANVADEGVGEDAQRSYTKNVWFSGCWEELPDVRCCVAFSLVCSVCGWLREGVGCMWRWQGRG